MNEPDPCSAALTRLREELKSALALSAQDHASMLAALGESMRLRESNVALVEALLAYMDDHNMAHDAATGDEPNTRTCPCDYCKQARAAIAAAQLNESAAAQEQTPSPRGDPEGGMAVQPASAADHEPEAA